MKNKQLNTNEAARRLGITIKELQNFRVHKRGPKVAKRVNNKCYYTLKDLDAWGKVRNNKPFRRRRFSKKGIAYTKGDNPMHEIKQAQAVAKHANSIKHQIQNEPSTLTLEFPPLLKSSEEVSDIGLDTLSHLIDVYKAKFFGDKTMILILDTLWTKLSSITHAINKLNERKK